MKTDCRLLAAGWLVLSVPAVSLPEKAAPVAVPVTVRVDATRIRSIGGIRSLDRYAWFGVYHEAGYGNKVVDGKKMDEWIWEEGRLWPSRGTIGLAQFPEDPARPSFIDPAAISNFTGKLARYVTAQGYDPNHKAIFSGRGHGDFPLFMCWPTNLTHGVPTVSNHLAHGEAVVRIFDRIAEIGGLMPKWYEVTNESSIQENFGWFWDTDAWEKLAEYHLGVADAMRASAHSNSVKVAGPTDAYPFRDGPAGDFSQWRDGNGSFVRRTGDRMGAYAMHAYEQSNGKTCYEDHLERFEVWHLGRLPALLDLWENEQFITWGNTLPFVFSEYGLLNNPQGDTNAFYQIRSCNGILLSLLDRPDAVDKMSAFIPSFAPYDLANRRVLFASDDGGISFYKTSYFEYLRFWRDLRGDYLFSHAGSPHLMQHAFLDGGTNLFVVMQNNFKDPCQADVKTALPAGAAIVSVEKQRLYHSGNDIARDPFAPVPDATGILIGPDETVMLRIGLSGMPDSLPVWAESNHYGDRTLVPMKAGSGEHFVIELPDDSGRAYCAGRLHLGLYAYSGFLGGLRRVSINGIDLGGLPDLSYTSGAPRHWTQVALSIPAGVLRNGTNIVTVVPSEGDPLMKITSVRLASEQVGEVVFHADRDLDGIRDVWEIEYGLDPSDYSDGALDPDGDGLDNAAEYFCGTDPFDRSSFLYICGASGSASGFRISFRSQSNRYYAVDVSGSLLSAWICWTNGICGNGEVLEMTDPGGGPRRFYRIRAGLEPF